MKLLPTYTILQMMMSGGGSSGFYLYALPIDGQSLSVGVTSSSAVITSGDLSGAYLFSGVSSQGNNGIELAADALDTYKSFAETSSQTQNHSLITTLQASITGEFLAMPHGKGSSSVEKLSPPDSVMYDSGMAMIDAASDIAGQLGLPLKYPFFTFIQGESGSNSLTSLRTLHDLYISAVNAKTGQTELPMILDQTGASYGRANALARLDYTDTYDDAIMACTKYRLNRLHPSDPTDSGDHTHLSPEGYVIQGEYYGIAGVSVMNDEDFKPFQPISYEVVGTTVEITCHVPVLPITLDASTLPQCPAEGFTYTGIFTGDVVPTVTVSDNKIILDIGTIPMRRDVIGFGYSLDDSATHPSGVQLPCGNIHDSQSTASAVAGFTLWNDLVQFEHEMVSGEGTNPELWRFDDPVIGVGGTYKATIEGGGTGFDSNLVPVVGDTYRIQFKHNGTQSLRLRFMDDTHTFVGTGSEESIDYTITLDSDSYYNNEFEYGSDGGFIGSIYDISIQKVE